MRHDLPALVEILAGKPWLTRPRDDDQRRAARGARGRPARGGPPPDHGQPRHAAARAVPEARPLRRAAARAARHRGRGAGRIRVAQDRHGRDPRRQRRRARPARRARRRRWGAEIRFIEYMDVGGATRWSRDRVVSRLDMFRTLAAAFGAIEPIPGTTNAPAERFRLTDGTVFGIIASTTDAVLQRLRPQPPDRRRALVPVSLCGAGHRPAQAAAGRRVHRRVCARSSPRPGAGAPTAAPRSGWRCAERAPLVPLTELKRDPAPRDAHAGRLSATRAFSSNV